LNVDLNSIIAAAMQMTVTQIIRDAGGAAAIVRAVHGAGASITRDAVYKWRLTGIPDRHWQVIIALTGIGPAELYEANCAARDQHHDRTVQREAAE
jgi:hypothetical protein